MARGRLSARWIAMVGMLAAALFITKAGTPNVAHAAAEPIEIQIQVIEATRTSSAVDPRLGKKLRDAVIGNFKGARLLDDLNLMVEPKKTVKIDVLNRSKVLEVTVRKVQTGQVQLRVAIEAFKFAANTTHRKNEATVVVGHKMDADTGLFLAVTPKF